MATESQSEWRLSDSYEFILKLLLCLKMNAPLNLNLRHIFATILGKFMFQMHCDAGIHVFFNYNETEKMCEIHHLYLDKKKSEGKYLVNALVERNKYGKINSEPPSYVGCKAGGMEAYGWFKLLQEWQNSRIISARKGDDIKEIIAAFNKERGTSSAEEQVSLISCLSDDIIVIPFNLTGYNLGLFFLWSNSQGRGSLKSLEKINGISKMLQMAVVRLLVNHYGITKKTYLPSFMTEGTKAVTILFADIRNFTTMTEIARNRGFTDQFHEFIHVYFKEMIKLVELSQGRVEKLAGDSIMGVFGEYRRKPKYAVRDAVLAASSMYGRFIELRDEFLERKNLEGFFERFNEPLQFDLGIGINFGEVYFGYFGRIGSHQYMGLGDHANFTKRLENEAARFDPIKRKPRAPILLSRTAYKAIDDIIIDKEGNPVEQLEILMLPLKGKSYEYPVYEFRPDIHKLKDG